jgi:hypothetical protein
MFERFGDLPLHVLVIHAAVVVLPLAALAGIAFAVVPQWRWLLRWPVLLLGLGTFVLAYVAKESGEAFIAANTALAQTVKVHQDRGNLLFWYALAFAVVALVAVVLLPGPSPLASGKGAKAGGNRIVNLVISAAFVVVAVLVAVQTVLTGHSGATAVWSGTLPN